jgi:hypothetical protein
MAPSVMAIANLAQPFDTLRAAEPGYNRLSRVTVAGKHAPTSAAAD